MDLSGVVLKDALLRHANLQGANLTNANLEGANLRSANLQDVNLTTVNQEGANFTDLNLLGSYTLEKVVIGPLEEDGFVFSIVVPKGEITVTLIDGILHFQYLGGFSKEFPIENSNEMQIFDITTVKATVTIIIK